MCERCLLSVARAACLWSAGGAGAIRYSDIAAAPDHFEQAFSADGGKTWKGN
jgi:hypothetical protein